MSSEAVLRSEFSILIAEDDPDDRLLTEDALRQVDPTLRTNFVEDGHELIECLAARNIPDLLFLDLNMPRKDGREALAQLRADEHLRALPIIVLTTSNAQHDIDAAYMSGANAYIVKPDTFAALLETMRSLTKFWFATAELPAVRRMIDG